MTQPPSFGVLLKQLENFLLDAVGLRQRGDTSLGEHLELGEVAGCGAEVSGVESARSRGEVLGFGAFDVGCGLELVDVRTEDAALKCNVADSSRDVRKSGLGAGGAAERGSAAGRLRQHAGAEKFHQHGIRP